MLKLSQAQKNVLEILHSNGSYFPNSVVSFKNEQNYRVTRTTLSKLTSLGLINGDVSMSLTELGKQTCEELFGKIESMQPVVETVEEVKEVSETSQLASMFTPQELYLMIDNLSKVSVFDNASIEASALAHNLRAKFNSTVKLLLETNTREELGFKCICHNLEFSDCPKLEVRKVA